MKVQMSSLPTELQRCSHSESGRPEPRERELLHRDRVVARAVDPDHVLELRQLVADGAELLHLLFVLDDHSHGVGVLEDVLALLGRVRLVDRHHRRSRAERGEVEVGPLGPRVGEDRDLVALGDAEVDQPEREALDDLADLAIGLRDPLSGGVLVGDGPEIGVALGRERQQVGDRLRTRALLRGCALRRCRCCLHPRSPPGWNGARAKRAPQVYWAPGYLASRFRRAR